VSVESSLVRSARVQARIIGALLLREIITRYGRHNIGFTWLFAEPMLFTIGVLLLWTTVVMHQTPIPVVPFTLSGYATVLLWRNTISRCGDAVEPNRSLLHHRNVRVIDLFAARILLEVAGATISFMVLALILGAIGLIKPPENIMLMITAWLLLAWFSIDLALLIGALASLSETAHRMWHVFSYLFLPLSGAFFLVHWLPRHFQSWVLLIPTVDCTEMLRDGLIGISTHAQYDAAYVVLFNAVMLLPGLLLLRIVARTVEGEG